MVLSIYDRAKLFDKDEIISRSINVKYVLEQHTFSDGVTFVQAT